ncbi:MAG: hypothetical protein LC797_10145, partial [Chloroflexi bacterium]|nr:hypothetical protein [Chloroflexota bacterium]
MTNSARDLLLHQSVDHLLTARYTVEAAFDDPVAGCLDASAGRELGFSLFAAINELLKLTLDFDDPDTFSKVERTWARMFDDVWMPSFPRDDLPGVWSDRGAGTPPRELMALLRRREVLRLGLVMWVGHLLDHPQRPERVQHLGQALGQLASRFVGIEWVLDTFDEASDDERPSTPWTKWFLRELPEDEGHYIPTEPNLLWAVLLLATRDITPDEPAALRPRDWFVWRRDEIAGALDRLEHERDLWQNVLGLAGPFGREPDRAIADPMAGWTARLTRLRELFARGAEEQEEQKRISVRAAPLDPGRVAELRDQTLRESGRGRLLRDTIERHA